MVLSILFKIVFWASLTVIVYVYVGYPLLVMIASRFKSNHVRKGMYQTSVSILIAAYNEEDVIEETIRNKLFLNYPKELIEIIIISDGSTDKTDEIVSRFSSQGVRLIRQQPRAGKTSALNLGISHALGEIVVFSDANSHYFPDALEKLLSNFSDSDVGYVTGKMIYTDPDGSSTGDGCSAYMRYENALRGAETRLGSIVGADGGIDAIRRELYSPMKPDQLPDFVLPLSVVEKGFRVVYESEAILREAPLKTQEDEYAMRVRVTLRAFWALKDMVHMLNLRRFGVFAWQMWSHKVLRYCCFIFMATLYCANAFLLSEGSFYLTLFILQNLMYLSTVISQYLERQGKNIRRFFIPGYFVLINFAALHALVKFLRGQKLVVWVPRKGMTNV
jgi:cellulose synthase/poly-beta-1,6-N-acetylglucosamine synthase-like glycosyltransferase